MGIFNAILVPLLAHAFGWTVGAIFAFIGAGLMLLVRADRPFYSAD
ncbi:MAG: hypothetical protein V3S21_03455 [Xanthomonadales bacterium]